MPAPTSRRPAGTLRLVSVGGTDILVSYTTLAFAALFAVLLGPQVELVRPGLGALRYVVGAGFAVLLYLAVLLHEASHAIVARRFGVVVPSITLHFLGGMTAVQGESRSPRQEFSVAVVGPLTSLAIGAVAWLAYQQSTGGLTRLALFGLAAGNLVIGVLNLLPGLPLDGGRVFQSLVWALSGNRLRGTIAAAWAGRVIAVLIACWPLLAEALLGTPIAITDLVIALLLASFVWTASSSELSSARLRSRVPGLVARELARRAVAVPEDLPLAEAVRRAQQIGATGIVTTTSSGTVGGIVDESALLAVPDERRDWVPVSSVARRIEAGATLSADLRGEALVASFGRAPVPEYVLVEADGSLFGVLAVRDVDRAVRGG